MTAKPPTAHTAEEITEWMQRNGLTQTAAAEALGISRRMLLYYLTGEKPVPRTVALACQQSPSALVEQFCQTLRECL